MRGFEKTVRSTWAIAGQAGFDRTCDGFHAQVRVPPAQFGQRFLRLLEKVLATGVGWVKHGRLGPMVRCANRFRTGRRVFKGLAPCGTHHFPAGSLHAPYAFPFHRQRNPHLPGVGRQILKDVVFRPREVAEPVGHDQLVTDRPPVEQIAG